MMGRIQFVVGYLFIIGVIGKLFDIGMMIDALDKKISFSFHDTYRPQGKGG